MRHLLLFICFFVWQLSSASDLEINFSHGTNEFPAAGLNLRVKTASGDSIVINKFKYYVGNFSLTYKSGMIKNFPKTYFLIDSEKPESMKVKLSNVADGEITKMAFGVGVDSLSNDEGLMDGDLDPMNGMYWAWNSGFINFKLEGECLNCDSTKEFEYHLGGFIHPNATYQTVQIPMQSQLDTINVKVDLAGFLGGFNLNTTPRVLSPSKKAKSLSELLPNIFSLQ